MATDLYQTDTMKDFVNNKEEASMAVKDLSFPELVEHYRLSMEKAAALIGADIVKLENGAFVFVKRNMI